MGKLGNFAVKKTPLFEFDVPTVHPLKKHAVGLGATEKQSR
jgi:hypothetical protein